ncbi:MAG: hypothetical protein F6K11_09405 [Leptolyngbya sp. SIO3F4]|nr:hypothetical protein [Leptolyngbya sp. SIO3F4]
MPIGDLATVLDLKPLSYNPFADGTVVYDNAGGVLVPRSASGTVAPLGHNPLLEARPSNASTQNLIDSAQSISKGGVKANAAALRGYQTTGDFFDTGAFGQALDQLSDAELNNFIDGVKTQGARTAAEAAAVAPRQAAQQLLRQGSQVAGALGTAIDAYNLAEAVLDPTNNPADEIGDVVGSMLGGALGTGLGPVGALGGSLLGGWVGRQLGNWLQGDGARANTLLAGDPPFEGGQCSGINYTVTLEYVEASNLGLYQDVRNLYPQPDGPVGSAYIVYNDANNSGRHTIYLDRGRPLTPLKVKDFTTGGFGTTPYDLKIVDIQRTDGQPDTCGNPPGPVVPTVTAPHYSPVALDPSIPRPTVAPMPKPASELAPLSQPFSAPTGQPLPQPTGVPTESPPEEPLKDPLPDPPGSGNLDEPPAPDDLPQPRLQPKPAPDGFDPNPQLPCCEQNTFTLEKLLHDIEALKAYFQASGFGTLDMSDCDSTTPYLLPWNGSGLTGIYTALETLSEATNRLWDKVKCPPDATAAVPMAWEIKVHEHPQLIILWGPAKGGSSRWAMHIPHPRTNINADYRFVFPQYTRGPVRGTLILSDNSRVVVNGASEAECKKVLAYVRGLIISNYLSGAQEVFTKGTAKFATRTVKAIYVKAFAGHRDQTPLWVKHIS